MDDIEKEEEILANCLRKACGFYGDEKKSHLKESSEILFSMAQLYIKKAEITDGMEQKLNFIRAAALLHGARVRFQKMLDVQKKVGIVLRVVKKMEDSLLIACKGKKEFDLMRISENVAEKFKHLRETEKIELGKLEIIPDETPEKEAHEKRVKKIDLVQFLMKKNAENFKLIMHNVAEKCLEILGEQPCQFAIAGLGSLAREEITLYSDFEHVIILEDGVPEREDYNDIQEYFRWFAVLFQIIVIGLGETLIPSVGVKSLNDLYSTNKSRRWFFDAFTPSGISFDGMMPHACKTPLGRQEITERKNHLVELIQPVSRMVRYLSSEEDMKNGYCLKDVLYQSCFVFGLEKIFDQFEREADKVIESNDKGGSFSSVSQEAKQNANAGIRGIHVLQASFNTVDSKTALYRPLSILLCYLARLYGIKKKSGFEKVPLCFERRYQFLMKWAFAVACEVRLKLYAKDCGNRKRVLGKEILEYIGRPCLINCTSTITDLARHLNKPWFQTAHNSGDAAELHHWPDSEPATLIFLQDEDKVKEVLLLQTHDYDHRSLNGLVDPINSALALSFCYFREALLPRNEEKQDKLLKKAQDTLDPMCLKVPRGRHMLASIYMVQKRFEEAFETMGSIFKDLDLTHHSVSSDDILNFRETQVDAARKCLNTNKMVDYCENSLSGDPGLPSRAMFRYALAREQFKLSKKGEAVDSLRYLMHELLNEGPRMLSKVSLIKLIHQIYVLQFNEHLQEECYVTLKMAEEVLESGPEIVDVSVMAPQFVSFFGVVTYLYTAHSSQDLSVSERIKLIEKAIRICKQPENFKLCEALYCDAIVELLEWSNNFRELSICRFANVLLNAPKSIQNNSRIKTEVLAKFVNNLIDCIQNPKGLLLESLAGALLMVEIMNQLHPMLGPWFALLYRKAFPNLEPVFASLIWSDLAERNRLECWSLDELTNASARCMVDFDWFERLEPAVNTLWRSLFIRRRRKKCTKKQLLKLLDYIYGFLCLDSLLDLRNIMGDFTDVDSLPSSRLKLQYKSALDGYMARYFDCAQKFWRIINLEIKGSILQRRSVVFLYWTVIEVLRSENGYLLYAKPDQGVFTVRHPEIVEEFSTVPESPDSDPLDLLRNMLKQGSASVRSPRII